MKERNQKIEAVLFDFGDTLVNIVPSREEIFTRSAGLFGLSLNITEVKNAYRIVDFHNKYSSIAIRMLKDRELFYKKYNMELCMVLGIYSYFGKLYPILREAFKREKEWQLAKGARFVLARLHQKDIPLGIVANWNRGLEALTERLGIRDFFSAILTSQEVGSEKPEQTIFKKALKALSVPKNSGSVFYIGNEYKSDVFGARNAGIVPVLIDKNNYYPFADCIRFDSLRRWFDSLSL